jgi:hypothetical protein
MIGLILKFLSGMLMANFQKPIFSILPLPIEKLENMIPDKKILNQFWIKNLILKMIKHHLLNC